MLPASRMPTLSEVRLRTRHSCRPQSGSSGIQWRGSWQRPTTSVTSPHAIGRPQRLQVVVATKVGTGSGAALDIESRDLDAAIAGGTGGTRSAFMCACFSFQTRNRLM